MFSKTKPSDNTPTSASKPVPSPSATSAPASGAGGAGTAAKAEQSPPAPKSAPAASGGAKPSPSLISRDLTIKGNMSTTGDIQVEGTVEGDVRAHLLTVGETATIRGEIVADDVVVNGRVVGRLRGLKVRLTESAQVEGDIVHKTIAIESGAHFEGSVQRNDDPLSDAGSGKRSIAAPSPQPAKVTEETAAG